MTNIPNNLKQKDTVFHYTNIKAAIEYILYEGELRLSPRKEAIDPIESTKPSFNYSSYGYEDTPKAEQVLGEKAKYFITDNLSKTKQLCFCMNKQIDNFDISMWQPYEFYGFLKPRMWDQYADRYRGVCLAFSLNKLKINSVYKNEPIKYENYDILKLNNNSIDLNKLLNMGFDSYCDNYLKIAEETLFQKHIDYCGENEYRFISFSNEKYEKLNIRESLIGIIVSKDLINEYSLERLKKYAEEYKVELIFIEWKENGLNISTKTQNDKLVDDIESMMKK